MKRLLAIALVGVLIVSAGCGMTSPEADQARNGQQTTTMSTTAASDGSNPSETAPIQAILPDGYSESGITNATLAYQQHQAYLSNNSFQLTYLRNDTEDGASQTQMAVTNGSGPEDRWRTTIGLKTGPVSQDIYQDGDTRYEKAVLENGTTVTTSRTEAFEMPEGTLGNETVVDLLEGMEVSSPQAMTRGNTTFIFYQVDGFDSTNVEGGHLVVMPSGQIRIIYIKYHGTEIAYTTSVSEDIDVQEPQWIQNATAES